MSEHQPVVVLLAKVMEEVRAVRKADRNTQQGYAFRGVDAVVNAVGPALRKHGIVPMPMLEKASYRDVTTSTGKPSRECTVEVRYRFYGPAGDHVDAVVPGESMDFGDKGAPKAMSVAYRIVLLQALCLPTDEADPDAHSYERSSRDALPPEEHEPPALSPRERNHVAAKVVEQVLEVADVEAAQQVWRDVHDSPANDVDVSGLLRQEDREALDIPEGEPLPLLSLVVKVGSYVKHHSRAVRWAPAGEAA